MSAIRVAIGRPFRSFDGYVFSGYGVYRQNPRYTHPQYVHNRAGFRNLREFSVEKPPGTLRVMAIGASVLYAAAAPMAELDFCPTDRAPADFDGLEVRWP